ncbi:hypothetical protein EC973_009631 [Apophysomyces ossiformis]|uniref:MULE transposase domain-containing protein n=1 Tax=Apophysomyces ossiformis TaxID=679940 RepID=A0A8H7BR27_9FUNG|nr:hypothetical protein EC973_009631 [Apophysomyces ossiformis]
MRPSTMFHGRRRNYKTCSACRGRQSDVGKAPPPESIITMTELEEAIARQEIPETGTVLSGYTFQGYIQLEADQISLSDSQLLVRIRNTIESCGDFKYYERFLTEPEKKTPNDEEVQRQLDDSSRRRLHTRMETFRCGGQVSGYIDRVNNVISLNIEHSIGHPAPSRTNHSVPESVREFIINGAINMSSRELYQRVLQEYPNETENLTTAQAYYWWHEGVVSSYRLRSDEIASSRLLISRASSKGVCMIFDQNERGVSALGFVTSLFNVASVSPFVEEFHVDSTYKTNRIGCELFGIIANVNGSGFPIAYMILHLDPRHTPEENTRSDVLKAFFTTLRQKGLQPKFMFTDKDVGQIAAIESTWEPRTLRLCLWHMQRSIKIKLAQEKLLHPIYNAENAVQEFPFIDPVFQPDFIDRSGIICPQGHRDPINAMITKHYNMHPLIPINNRMYSALEIHSMAVQEMYDYCKQSNLPDAWPESYPFRFTQLQYNTLEQTTPSNIRHPDATSPGSSSASAVESAENPAELIVIPDNEPTSSSVGETSNQIVNSM